MPFRKRDVEMIRAYQAEQKRRQEIFSARCELALFAIAVVGLVIFATLHS